MRQPVIPWSGNSGPDDIVSTWRSVRSSAKASRVCSSFKPLPTPRSQAHRAPGRVSIADALHLGPTTSTASPPMQPLFEKLGYKRTWSEIRLIRAIP